jgi:AcrR family transcriptional regulator
LIVAAPYTRAVPRISEAAKAARRAQILDAARDLFTRNGFHATSMDDILRSAGMSAGGAYRYFASKDDIIAAIAAEVLGGLSGTVDVVLAEDPPPTLDAALRRLIRYVDGLADGQGRLALVVWGEAQRDPHIARLARGGGRRIRDLVRELVRRAQVSGEVSCEVDADVLGDVVFSLVPGYLMQKRLLGDVDPESYADGVHALLTGGRAAPGAAAGPTPATTPATPSGAGGQDTPA